MTRLMNKNGMNRNVPNHFTWISERFCDVDPNKETKNSIE